MISTGIKFIQWVHAILIYSNRIHLPMLEELLEVISLFPVASSIVDQLYIFQYVCAVSQWVSRENLQETIVFPINYGVFL